MLVKKLTLKEMSDDLPVIHPQSMILGFKVILPLIALMPYFKVILYSEE
jgi:hypothetical protein